MPKLRKREEEDGNKPPKKPTRTKFPDRLQWKMKHLSMPTTSTPKRGPKSEKFTKDDIEKAFGFDDSVEADYSTLLSPIALATPRGIVPPIYKANPLSQRNADCDPKSPVSGLPSKKKSPKPAPVLGENDGKERRSARLRNAKKVVKPPISSRPVVTPKTNDNNKKAPESVPVPDEFQLPDIIEASELPTPTTSKGTKKKAQVKTSTKSSKAKSKPVTVKKAKTKVATSSKQPAKVPLHLERQPHLFEADGKNDNESKGNSPFSQLLHRYNEDEDKVEEEPLHVDPKKIVRTYAHRKRVKYSEDRDPETEYDFVPRSTPDEVVLIPDRKAAQKPKRKNARKHRKELEDELDDETRKWLDEKNKEFDDVAKVKLVIEKSFSD